MPPWINPNFVDASTLMIWVALAYFTMIMGGEWISDALCTLTLAMEWEPLFVGLIVTTLTGVAPVLAFTTFLAQAKATSLIIGSLIGGSWAVVLLPLALAGLYRPLLVHERWMRIDLPLFIIYFIVFTFFCLEGGIQSTKASGMIIMAAVYLFFRYAHGKDSRYGLTTFGNHFVFGSSIINTLLKLALGAGLMLGATFYLALVAHAGVERWHLPAMPLGFLLILPFCTSEIIFAFSANKKGQGDLILGRGLGLATLFILLGGWIIGIYHLPIDPNDINFIHLAFVVVLFLLWVFLRSSARLWRWQAFILLVLTLACLGILWAQSYGRFMFLRLPREFLF